MVINPKLLVDLDGNIQKAVNDIARALELRNMNVRIVHGKISEEEFSIHLLKGGDLAALNAARKAKDLLPVHESNNFQTLSDEWSAITAGKSVVVSPCYGQRSVNSNDQVDNEVAAVAKGAKISVERFDNGQNSVYFLNLAKKKKTSKKKAETNEDDSKG